MLDIGLRVVGLSSALENMGGIFVSVYLLRLSYEVLVIWYLLRPEVGRALARNHEMLKINP
jgi:hypothetical protein